MKNCLFDIDGVIVPENGLFFEHRFSEEYGISRENLRNFFENEFLDCLRGKKSIRSELSKYLPQWGSRQSNEDVLEFWLTTERDIDRELLDFIDRIRERGIKCYIVSNQFRERAEYLLEDLGLSPHFDGAFFSCFIGYLKDEAEFFQTVLESFPEDQRDDVVFWDNDRRYVYAAKQTGIHSRLYTNFAEFKKEMQTLLS